MDDDTYDDIGETQARAAVVISGETTEEDVAEDWDSYAINGDNTPMATSSPRSCPLSLRACTLKSTGLALGWGFWGAKLPENFLDPLKE